MRLHGAVVFDFRDVSVDVFRLFRGIAVDIDGFRLRLLFSVDRAVRISMRHVRGIRVYFHRFYAAFGIVGIFDFVISARQQGGEIAGVNDLRAVLFAVLRALRHRADAVFRIMPVRAPAAVRQNFRTNDVRSTRILVLRLVPARFVQICENLPAFGITAFSVELTARIQAVVDEGSDCVAPFVIFGFFHRLAIRILLALLIFLDADQAALRVVTIIFHEITRGSDIVDLTCYGRLFRHQLLQTIVSIIDSLLQRRACGIDLDGAFNGFRFLIKAIERIRHAIPRNILIFGCRLIKAALFRIFRLNGIPRRNRIALFLHNFSVQFPDQLCQSAVAVKRIRNFFSPIRIGNCRRVRAVFDVR